MKRTRWSPGKQGLYNPENEHDSCGVGFICNIDGAKSKDIVKKGLKVLNRLAHRGAVGADPKTGDGAGILIQLPHEFLSKVTEKEKIELPSPGEYGTGIIFLPQDVMNELSAGMYLAGLLMKKNKYFSDGEKYPLITQI